MPPVLTFTDTDGPAGGDFAGKEVEVAFAESDRTGPGEEVGCTGVSSARASTSYSRRKPERSSMDGRHLSLRKRLGLELYRRLHREAVERHELRTLFWECTARLQPPVRPLRFGLHGLARLPRHAGRRFFPRARPPDHAPRRSAPRDGRPLGRRGARALRPGTDRPCALRPRIPVGDGHQRHGAHAAAVRRTARGGSALDDRLDRRIRGRAQPFAPPSAQFRPRCGGGAHGRRRAFDRLRRRDLRHAGARAPARRVQRSTCSRWGCGAGGCSRSFRRDAPPKTLRCNSPTGSSVR